MKHFDLTIHFCFYQNIQNCTSIVSKNQSNNSNLIEKERTKLSGGGGDSNSRGVALRAGALPLRHGDVGLILTCFFLDLKYWYVLRWQGYEGGPAQKEPTRFKIDLHCPYRDVESPARALCYPRVPDQSMVLASIWTVLRPPTSPAAGGQAGSRQAAASEHQCE